MSLNYHEISRFESRAKLMVSGEYLVLKGALALALPLKYGQKLTVKVIEGESMVYWQSRIKDKLWFYATFQLPHFKVTDSNLPEISDTLSRILIAAKELNPAFPALGQEYRVTSEMDFDPAWGIGSGSSLVSNIASWAECNPFELNRIIFKGSGYDIACARSSHPIIYKTTDHTPSYHDADFQPQFHENLYFVYLNRKQDTLKSISGLDLASVSSGDTEAISGLTLEMEKAENLTCFQSLMNQHEEIISRIIRKTPVRQSSFGDFAGSVKSLGAWGGDFILAAADASEEYVRNYFTHKNLTTIFKYSEIILNRKFSEPDLSQTGSKEFTPQVQNDKDR